jgi:hypothetical protein
MSYKVAQHVLKGEHVWLEEGIVGIRPTESRTRAAPAAPALV